MTAFVVITSDDKQGVLNPAIYGPFETSRDADAFIERHPRWNGMMVEPSDGGYCGAIVVDEEAAEDPVATLAEWAAWRRDYGIDEEA